MWIDGFGPMPGGMNSGIVPTELERTQAAFATNCTFRGLYITHRPPIERKTFDYGGDAALQALVENGLWQGAASFRSEYGEEGIVASIGGRIFFFVIALGLTTIEVRDVTPITGGVDDPNSSSSAIAWLWQAERWMIINDGQSFPIFFDGQITRRSDGPSRPINIAGIDFVAPALGGTVDITLSNIYAGRYNTTIFIDGAFYQVNSSSTVIPAHEITVTNLTAIPGTAINANTLIVIPTPYIALALSSQLPKPGTVDYDGHHHSCGPSSQLYRVQMSKHLPEGMLVSIPTTDGQIGVFVVKGIDPNASYLTILCSNSATSGRIAYSTPVYQGYFTPHAIAGTIISAAVTPAYNASIVLTLDKAYDGPLPQDVTINNKRFRIIGTNNDAVPSGVINVTNVNDTPGAAHGPSTPATPGQLATIPELSIGRMGAYGLGRNWYSLADGRSFRASDIVGGSSGSPSVANRDAVLRETENTFLTSGDFVIPGNLGDIRSMVFTATLDAALGQGPLQVGTSNTIFSCQAPVERATWQVVTNPILTESLKGKGPLGQYGTILVNSDTLFRAFDGIGSLILARREFATWGNTPISQEMKRVIDLDVQDFLANASAVEFDNRVLMTAFPVQGPLGVYHQGLISLNSDPVSNLRGKAPSIYDGLWTGINIFQFVTGLFSGVKRSFAFTFYAPGSRMELWELLPTKDGNFFDNGSTPITFSFESPVLFSRLKGKGEFELAELIDGELYISDLVGAADIQVWYRPDYDDCWHVWHKTQVCANNANGTIKQYRKRIGLGAPSVTECNANTKQPARVGFNFQVRVQISGHCVVRGAIFKAHPVPQSESSVPSCDVLCDTTANVQPCAPCESIGSCLQFPIVFYNFSQGKQYTNVATNVTCPSGIIVTVPPGTVNYTLPFPPDFSGDYPPLVLGCAAGGNVVRLVPPGSTQEQIDAIVEEMIAVCVQAVGLTLCKPATAISNQAVQSPSCPLGETMSYSGDLPYWITIESDHLVGAAGTFFGSNQAQANATAQAELDAFYTSATGLGDLTCNPASDICTDGVGALLPNVYQIVGFVDGLFENTFGDVPTVEPVWDGVFHMRFGTNRWVAGEILTYQTDGRIMCNANILFDNCLADVPQWLMQVRASDDTLLWEGLKAGGQTPEGTYDRTDGADSTPASVDVELTVGTTTVSGSFSCTT